MDSPKSLNAFILSRLAPDETVLWYGTPDAAAYKRRNRRSGFIVLYAVVVPVIAALLFTYPLTATSIGSAFCAFLICVIGCYIVGSLESWDTYVVTSTRLLLDNAANEYQRLQQLRYKDLQDVVVHGQGTVGTIQFPKNKTAIKFELVKDPQAVAEIIESARAASLGRQSGT
jgi:hypothetical protein